MNSTWDLYSDLNRPALEEDPFFQGHWVQEHTWTEIDSTNKDQVVTCSQICRFQRNEFMTFLVHISQQRLHLLIISGSANIKILIKYFIIKIYYLLLKFKILKLKHI